MNTEEEKALASRIFSVLHKRLWDDLTTLRNQGIDKVRFEELRLNPAAGLFNILNKTYAQVLSIVAEVGEISCDLNHKDPTTPVQKDTKEETVEDIEFAFGKVRGVV